MYEERKAYKLVFLPQELIPFCEESGEKIQDDQRLFLLGEMWFENDENMPPSIHEYWLGAKGRVYMRVRMRPPTEADLPEMNEERAKLNMTPLDLDLYDPAELKPSSVCINDELVVALFYGRFVSLWEKYGFVAWRQYLPEGDGAIKVRFSRVEYKEINVSSLGDIKDLETDGWEADLVDNRSIEVTCSSCGSPCISGDNLWVNTETGEYDCVYCTREHPANDGWQRSTVDEEYGVPF